VVYAICREGATQEDTDAAYARLRKQFLDWNEIRVSTVQEVADILKPLPDTGTRARRIIGLLQKVFEEEYSFSLEDLGKKGLKQAAKQLSRYKEEVDDFIVAWVVQRALGGHAMPLDTPTMRVLERLHVIQPNEAEDAENLEALRATIEHIVPKTRGAEMTELLSLLARDICVEGTPKCAQCPLNKECPTGIERLSKKPGSGEKKSIKKSR
jgi:endonuclease III